MTQFDHKPSFDVVVIGGGIVGLFCAYYLNAKGQKVLLLDKGPNNEACSHGNCGLVSPSHINPLNDYGLILNSLLSMTKQDAPLRIKPQLSLKFWGWCAQFLRHSSPKYKAKSTLAIHGLLQSSRKLYEHIIKTEGIKCNWSDKGIHFVFKNKSNFEQFEKKFKSNESFGVTPSPLIGNALLDREPSLREDVYGSWFYNIDASLKPDMLVLALKNLIVKNGVHLMSEQEVVSFSNNARRIESITTHKGQTFSAKKIVLATGAWSPFLGEKLGLKIPVIPGKGYSITMESPILTPSAPLLMVETKIVATPWKDCYRLGSTMELAGYDSQLNKKRLEALRRGAKEYLRHPYSPKIHEHWFGWRPMTYDGVPIIDKSPLHENLFLALGHNMLGLSMAPGTGMLMSEIIMGEKTHLDRSLYSCKK